MSIQEEIVGALNNAMIRLNIRHADSLSIQQMRLEGKAQWDFARIRFERARQDLRTAALDYTSAYDRDAEQRAERHLETMAATFATAQTDLRMARALRRAVAQVQHRARQGLAS